MEFWDILYAECRKHNLSPNKLAEKLELSNATMTKWKKGSQPSADKIIAIADIFGVSTVYLLGRSGADPELPADEMELLQNYRKADERGKKRIRRAAEDEAGEQQDREQKPGESA